MEQPENTGLQFCKNEFNQKENMLLVCSDTVESKLVKPNYGCSLAKQKAINKLRN